MDPTEDALIGQIKNFIDAHGYEQDNQLLLYYAGHGYIQERNGRKFSYLVPVNAPNPSDNARAFFQNPWKENRLSHGLNRLNPNTHFLSFTAASQV